MSNLEKPKFGVRFNPDFVRLVLDSSDLVSIVAEKVKLERKANDFTGLCPFHKEKTPSFFVVPNKQFYHCFGCGESGNAISWLEKTEGLNFVESVTRLANAAHIALPEMSHASSVEAQNISEAYSLFEGVKVLFQDMLTQSPTAVDYLKLRKINKDMQDQFFLGYCPFSIDLQAWAKSKGFKQSLLKDYGLVTNFGKARFAGRLMFPIGDGQGRTIAFGGRSLNNDPKQAKYVNSRESKIFSKSNTLYNLHNARKSGDKAILVEGYLDCITMVQAGFGGALAPLGTAVSDNHMNMLWQYSDCPLILFDGDDAGKKATDRVLLNNLGRLSVNKLLSFGNLPKDQDPSSYLELQGKSVMSKLIQSPQSSFERLWDISLPEDGSLSSAEVRAKFRYNLQQKISQIQDRILSSEYNRKAKDLLFNLNRKSKKTKVVAGSSKGEQDFAACKTLETRVARMVCLCLYYYPELLNDFIEEIAKLHLPSKESNFLELLIEAATKTTLDKEGINGYIKLIADKSERRSLLVQDFYSSIVNDRATIRLAPYKLENDMELARAFLQAIFTNNRSEQVTKDLLQHSYDQNSGLIIALLALKDKLKHENDLPNR